MSVTAPIQDKQTLIFISNRWINTIYTGYGIIKQRILLEIFEHLQKQLDEVMNGKKTVAGYNLKAGHSYPIALDMSKIQGYNNYHNVRKAIDEMCKNPIQVYNDPAFKKSIYFSEPLLHWSEPGDKKYIRTLYIKKEMLELLLHVNYGWSKKKNKNTASQFTGFDRRVISSRPGKGPRTGSSSRYMHPLYTMICSYADRGGFTIPVDDFRARLDVEEKYKGMDNLNRFVIKHVQAEMKIMGDYGFNYSFVKRGRTVTQITFVIFPNKKQDANHTWMKIYRALNEELPYYVRLNELQRSQFNYLLTGGHDLEKVLDKFKYIHGQLEKRKAEGRPVVNAAIFVYILKGIHETFPPPG